MPYETTTKGYIELHRTDGQLVSRHTLEREAMESLSRQPNGDYILRYPNVACRVYGGSSAGVPLNQLGNLGGEVRITSYGGGVAGRSGSSGGTSGVGALAGQAGLAIVGGLDTFVVSAVIPLYDSTLTLLGYGPSLSSNGVFFGMSGLANGDKWKFDPVAGLTLIEEVGGIYTASGPAGTYNLPWRLFHAATGVITTGVKTGVTLV